MKFEDLQFNKTETGLDLKPEKIEKPNESPRAETNNFDLSQEIAQAKIEDAQEIQKVRQEIAAVPKVESLPTVQKEDTEATEQKSSWLASKLNTAARYLKVATLGVGVFMGANKLEANNINKDSQSKLTDRTEQAPSLENKNEKSIDGGNLVEIVVYGRKQYEEELSKQESNLKKYLTDLEEYKQDSVEWAKADKAFPDSLQAYHFTKSLEQDIQAIKKISADFENTPEIKRLNDLYRQRDILEKDKSRVSELEKIVNEIYKIWDDPERTKALEEHNKKINEISANLDKYGYHGVPKGMLEKEGVIERVDYQTIYKDIQNYAGKSTSREKLPIKLDPKEFKLFLANTDGWNFYPYFKKPNMPIKPERPLRNFTEKITYDPKYEDLNMRSLWATMVKKNPNEKIGTLHAFDYNFEKGFTLEEAMSFPQEIKDKYNIDYIYKQVHDKR